jgi:hypothetical protein
MTHTYKAPLSFKIESQLPEAKFLDTIVYRSGSRLCAVMQQKNESWAVGTSDLVVKHTLPPVLDRPLISKRRIAAYLSARFHRTNQLHPAGDSDRYRSVVVVMKEVHRLGYSSALIKRALNSVRHPKVADLCALAAAVCTALDSSSLVSPSSSSPISFPPPLLLPA